MITAAVGDRVRFITQPDHAELAGQLAERWGNEAFEGPKPYPAVVNAAANHDVGWWEYDRCPHLDDAGIPVDFRRVPAESWIDFYERGISTVVELDAYAGLLASMHGSGLRRRRYGLSPSWPPPEPPFSAFVERQESQQRQLLDRLSDSARYRPYLGTDTDLLEALHESGEPPTDRHASRLWQNYRLLQAWDALSLILCGTVAPADPRTIEAVPLSLGDSGRRLSVQPTGRRQFDLDPYPFERSPVEVSVPARTVEMAAVDSQDDLVWAYYDAEFQTIPLVIRRGAT